MICQPYQRVSEGVSSARAAPATAKDKARLVKAARIPDADGSGDRAATPAVRAVSETLRLELNGTEIRVLDIAPGLAETE